MGENDPEPREYFVDNAYFIFVKYWNFVFQNFAMEQQNLLVMKY